MGVIVSLSDVRKARVKDILRAREFEGRPAMIETRTRLIVAEKILCRETLVEMFNALGDYFCVHYADIVSVRPAAPPMQTSAVNDRGDWMWGFPRAAKALDGMLLHFPERSRG